MQERELFPFDPEIERTVRRRRREQRGLAHIQEMAEEDAQGILLNQGQ